MAFLGVGRLAVVDDVSLSAVVLAPVAALVLPRVTLRRVDERVGASFGGGCFCGLGCDDAGGLVGDESVPSGTGDNGGELNRPAASPFGASVLGDTIDGTLRPLAVSNGTVPPSGYPNGGSAWMSVHESRCGGARWNGRSWVVQKCE